MVAFVHYAVPHTTDLASSYVQRHIFNFLKIFNAYNHIIKEFLETVQSLCVIPAAGPHTSVIKDLKTLS